MLDSDENLMKAVARGHSPAFALLAERYMDRLYFFIYRQLGHRTAAEDVAQDVFMKVWQKPHLFDASKGQFRAWLWTIAANDCLDLLRKNKFSHSPDELNNIIDFQPLPDKRAEDSSELAAVIEEIENLPARQKQALYLFVYDELSYKEIAALLDLSAAAVESLISRARATLRTNTKKPNREKAYVC